MKLMIIKGSFHSELGFNDNRTFVFNSFISSDKVIKIPVIIYNIIIKDSYKESNCEKF